MGSKTEMMRQEERSSPVRDGFFEGSSVAVVSSTTVS